MATPTTRVAPASTTETSPASSDSRSASDGPSLSKATAWAPVVSREVTRRPCAASWRRRVRSRAGSSLASHTSYDVVPAPATGPVTTLARSTIRARVPARGICGTLPTTWKTTWPPSRSGATTEPTGLMPVVDSGLGRLPAVMAFGTVGRSPRCTVSGGP